MRKKRKAGRKAKLTVRTVAALQPRQKAYEVPDSELKGFTVRVEPTGTKTFYVRYRLPNRRQGRVKLGQAAAMSAEQARDLAKMRLGELYRGDDPMESKRQARAMTLRQYLKDVYEPWILRNRRAYSAKESLRRMRTSFKGFLDKPLGELHGFGFEKWRTERLKDCKAATTNRELAELRAALNRAVDWGHMKESPLRRVKQSKEDRSKRVRYLTDDERTALFEALDKREEEIRKARDSHNEWLDKRGYPTRRDLRAVAYADHFKPMIILLLNTGLRRGELLNLQWADVSLDRNPQVTVRGEGAKSGQTRHVPLNSTAADVFRQWRAQTEGDGLIFVAPDGGRFKDISNLWEKLRTDAGLKDFRLHDCRHDFASRLAMAGVDLAVIRELLGHSDFSLTLRYAHLQPQKKAEAVERIVDGPGNVIPFPKEAKR